MLHRLSLDRRFVHDLFVPDFPDFVNFMHLLVVAYTQKHLVS